MIRHPLLRALEALSLAAVALGMVSAIGTVVALIDGDKPGFSLPEQGTLFVLSSLVYAAASHLARELKRRGGQRLVQIPLR